MKTINPNTNVDELFEIFLETLYDFLKDYYECKNEPSPEEKNNSDNEPSTEAKNNSDNELSTEAENNSDADEIKVIVSDFFAKIFWNRLPISVRKSLGRKVLYEAKSLGLYKENDKTSQGQQRYSITAETFEKVRDYLSK